MSDKLAYDSWAALFLVRMSFQLAIFAICMYGRSSLFPLTFLHTLNIINIHKTVRYTVHLFERSESS